MSVYSVGVDLIEIERIEKLLDKYGDKFLKRIFTDTEIQYCQKKKDRGSYAARFAYSTGGIYPSELCGLMLLY